MITKIGYQDLTDALKAIISGSTVEDYGAVGDGVAIDTPAVLAMIAAKGYAAFRSKRYNLAGFSFSGETLILVGEKTPRNRSGILYDGTILLGMLSHSVSNVSLTKLGHIANGDGIVINSGVGLAYPGSVYVRDVIGVGSGEAGTSHAILLQGFSSVDILGISGSDAQYGVVVKSQNGMIDHISVKNCRTAGLYIKGDTGAPSGNVSNGSVVNMVVGDVISDCSNSTCAAVYVQSSTSLVSKVTIGKVKSLGGRCGVDIAGGGTGALQTNTITVDSIVSEAPNNAALVVSGNPSEISVSKVMCVNPVSGRAFDVSESSVNCTIAATNLVISSTFITSVDAGVLGGNQNSFGSFTVRNPYRTMLLTCHRSKNRIGETIGNVKLLGDGNIAMINGASSVSGNTCAVETIAGGLLRMIGRVNMTGVTIANNPVIGTFPFSVNADAIVTAAARLDSGVYVNVRLYISGTVLQVLDAAATSIESIYLDGIFVQITKNMQ